MAYTFDQIFAADPSNPANVARNAAVTIFAPGDAGKTPLTLTTTEGDPLPNPVQVNANGFGSAFMHATLDRVAWAGGNFTGFFTAYEGMKNEAVAARDAANASATAAAASAALVGAPADTAIAAAINASGSATKTALSATYGPAAQAASTQVKDAILNHGMTRFAPHESAQFAAAGVNAIIARGRYSCTIQAIGDSTNSGQVRWPRELANEFADHFPNHTVWWQPWDDTLQKYIDPTVVQLGPLGERSVSFDGTAGRQYAVGASQNVAAITGDISVEAKLAPTSWANGASQIVAAQYRAGGNNRGWQFYLRSDGKLGFIWSEDGIATKLAESTVAVPYAAAAAGWIRVSHDVDTGGSANDVKFYTSTDGGAWTQLGTTITAAGVTSHYNTTTPFTIAHLGSDVGGNVGSGWLAGKMHIIRIRNGLQGHTILPELPEDWDAVDDGSNGTVFNGSPIIRMLIGAVGGTSSVYFNDTTRRVKLFAPNGQRLLFIGTGLNEGGQWSNFILNYFRTVLTDLQTIMPAVPIVMLGQNPTQATGTYTNDHWAAQQEHISALLLTLAATTRGVYGLDTFPAFTNRVTEVPDGQHPVGTGPVSQASRIFNAMFYPG